MKWFTENWFWVLVFIAFNAMHLFGHGQRSRDEREKDEAQGRVGNSSLGGHQH